MTPNDPSLPGKPTLLPAALSFLAPAALVLLPALALAFASGEKNETYEWTQHRVAGLAFAAAFASVLLGGCWRKGWPATLSALTVLAVLITVAVTGLPEFHLLFGLAGGIVAVGYWFAPRHSRPPLLEVGAVGFCSAFCFWAVSRLSWWQPFEVTLVSWPNKIIFIAVTALLVWALGRVFHSDESLKRHPRVTRAIDAIALLALAAVTLRTNSLQGNLNFPHHWSVYATPVDLVREGRVLLGEVPSQYGFLATLILAALPVDDSFSALYWLNGILTWTAGTIVYFTLRTWLAHWCWQLGAALITVSGATLLTGYAPDLAGPMLYPSIGAMRFIWVYVLLGFLLWRHLAHGKNAADREPDRQALWIGSGIWLAGVLWSVESAAYVTAAWFPAGALLAMIPTAPGAGRLARCRALLTGIGHSLLITAFLLVVTVLVTECLYWFVLGRIPEWSAYWEYAAAFAQGFGALPIEPWGGIWALLLLHATLLSAIISVDPNRQRSATALIWAAWGAFWAVSTYYVSRSHINNITNLSPVLLLVVGLMVHALRPTALPQLARPWIWLTVPSYVGAMLWLVLTNQSTLRSQIASYAVEPHVALLLPPRPPELDELIAQCLARKPGPYAVLGHSENEVIRFKPIPGQKAWLPISSLPLFNPLEEKRRFAYLDIYRRDRVPGWFIAPIDQFEPSPGWLVGYINSRYFAEITLTHQGWNAWYCVPNPAFDARPVPQD